MYKRQAGTLPLLPQARELAQEGIIPAGAYRNRAHLEGKVSFHAAVPLDVADIMFDPQTAGGLLISVAPQDAERLSLIHICIRLFFLRLL